MFKLYKYIGQKELKLGSILDYLGTKTYVEPFGG